jgi:hypothetical protein
MSNEDEDEVEEELERMEREAIAMPTVPLQPLTGDVVPSVTNSAMPDVPNSTVSGESERLQKQKERARARKVALHA